MSRDEPPLRPQKKPDRPAWVMDLSLFAVIVSDIVAYTGAGIGVGYLLWEKAGFPWWTLVVTSLLGLSLAMHRIYRIGKRFYGDKNGSGPSTT